MQTEKQNIYAIINPAAGNADLETIERALADLCQENGWNYEFYKTSGTENLSEVTRRACANGFTVVAAAGGDGTVAGVADGLINTGIPLVIIPAGTGNGLARAMKIPLEVEKATKLLAQDHCLHEIDAIRVEDKFYVLNVSAGISSAAMQQTASDEKKKKGILAYAETIAKDLPKIEASVFDLEIDGVNLQVEAVEVLISNGRILKESPLLFGPRTSFKDGQFEVNILTASNLSEYAGLVWDMVLNHGESNPNLQIFTVKKQVRIAVQNQSMLVQADGEVIGHTPVNIQLVPQGICLVVPEGEKV